MAEYEQNAYYHSRNNSHRRGPKLSVPLFQRKTSRKDLHHFDRTELTAMGDIQEIKSQNARLKKMLKEAQAKRSQVTKDCCEYEKVIEELENKNSQLLRKIQDNKAEKQGDRYRVDELKFLNKQLTSEVEELREENSELNERLRYSSDVLERKYEDLEEKTLKRIEQALKRTKKSIHYLQTLSSKDIEKTKDILIENLRKANDLLRGKYCEENQSTDYEINELMNPLKNIQDELMQKTKELSSVKSENSHLKEQIKKHKKIERELLPQYKDAIEKLKKNLAQVRSQLSENEYEKSQLKKKYEEKVKTIEHKYNDLFTEYRKNKLEKHIFENKLQDLENQAEEEKERLIGENEILKKLYKSNSEKEVDQYEKYAKQIMDDSNFDDSQMEDVERNTVAADYYDNRRVTTKITKPTFSDETAREHRKNKHLQMAPSDFKKHRQSQVSHHVSRTVYHNAKTKPEKAYQKEALDYSNVQEEYAGKYEDSDSQQENQAVAQCSKFAEASLGNQCHREKKVKNYQQESSILSQESLKNEICKIDQEITEIQRNLTKELEAYR